MQSSRYLINKSKCIVVDFGFTLCSAFYFNVSHPRYPNFRELIEKHIIHDVVTFDKWVQGDLTTSDIAELLTNHIQLGKDDIIKTMENGCKNLKMNEAVWNFVLEQKSKGKVTILVTANLDIFSTVVVPSHGLEKLFDAIYNTADYKEVDKTKLWEMAFTKTGNQIGYHNSLLIEDGKMNVDKFKSKGGMTYQYSSDDAFKKWLMK